MESRIRAAARRIPAYVREDPVTGLLVAVEAAGIAVAAALSAVCLCLGAPGFGRGLAIGLAVGAALVVPAALLSATGSLWGRDRP